MEYSICPLVLYFPTFSTTNSETTRTFEKTKVNVQSYKMHLLAKKLE
jgi:hypothetical protein